jgi:hypothetical protein
MAQQIKITQTSNADMNIGILKNLTAVEWLALRYHHRQGYLSQDDIAEAKEMEKEQITDAVIFGVEQLSDSGDLENENRAEQYYNETHKK